MQTLPSEESVSGVNYLYVGETGSKWAVTHFGASFFSQGWSRFSAAFKNELPFARK